MDQQAGCSQVRGSLVGAEGQDQASKAGIWHQLTTQSLEGHAECWTLYLIVIISLFLLASDEPHIL